MIRRRNNDGYIERIWGGTRTTICNWQLCVPPEDPMRLGGWEDYWLVQQFASNKALYVRRKNQKDYLLPKNWMLQ